MATSSLNFLAIVGPTASGKTALAIDIAKRHGAEIIAADSRTVYKGLDIGTAKPSLVDRQGIPHWGFDLVGPGESFTVADFKAFADQAIADIQARGLLPIMVGGSGLYIDAVLYDFNFAPAGDEEQRKELELLDIIELQRRITEAGLTMPENARNKRYLVRTLERGHTEINRHPLRQGWHVIGLNPPKVILEDRIRKRAALMVDEGVVNEVAWAVKQYGPESQALTGGIYRLFGDVVIGSANEDEALNKFIRSDIKMAKRQLTWLKRNRDIEWFESAGEALDWFSRTFEGKLE